MNKLPKCCKGCIHATPIYGNYDKTGKRVISSYSCSAKHGGRKTQKISPKLKQCDNKEKW